MLKSLFWIGATGIALIGGIALYHGDDIARGAHELTEHAQGLEEIGDTIEREMDAADDAIAEGADAEESYEDALAAALVSSGILTEENIDDIDEDEGRTFRVNDGVRVDVSDVIERARTKIAEAQEAQTAVPSRDISGDDIDDILGALEELEKLDGNLQIDIQ